MLFNIIFILSSSKKKIKKRGKEKSVKLSLPEGMDNEETYLLQRLDSE